jgi:hypothetical protein
MTTTVKTMSDTGKYEAVQSQVNPDHDQVGEQMMRRDEYLSRNLHRMRIFVRTLDLGFGYIPRPNRRLILEFPRSL